MTAIIRNVEKEIRNSDLDRIANILNINGIVILPADTVYGLIGKAFDPVTFERIDQIKVTRKLPYSVIFDSISNLESWYGGFNPACGKIINALLPGPVTCILPSNNRISTGFRYHNDGIGVRVISDPVYSHIIQYLGSPIWASSANRSGEPAPVNFAEIKPSLLQMVDMAIDMGPTRFRQESSVIDMRQIPFKIKREGPWANRIRSKLNQITKPYKVLTVCTGNICRSPLAAALIQQNLGLDEESGIEVTSCGVGALEDYPASQEMILIGKEWGVDLTRHKARQINSTMIEETDLILIMSASHRDQILSYEPGAVNKIHLLGEHIGEEDIPDPYQLGELHYRHSAGIILRAVEAWGVELRRNVLSSINQSPKSESEAERNQP